MRLSSLVQPQVQQHGVQAQSRTLGIDQCEDLRLQGVCGIGCQHGRARQDQGGDQRATAQPLRHLKLPLNQLL